MEGEFDLDQLVKDHAKTCYPSNEVPNAEPIVYRETIEALKEGFIRDRKRVGE